MSFPSDFSLREAYVGTPEFGPALQSSDAFGIFTYAWSKWGQLPGHAVSYWIISYAMHPVSIIAMDLLSIYEP